MKSIIFPQTIHNYLTIIIATSKIIPLCTLSQISEILRWSKLKGNCSVVSTVYVLWCLISDYIYCIFVNKDQVKAFILWPWFCPSKMDWTLLLTNSFKCFFFYSQMLHLGNFCSLYQCSWFLFQGTQREFRIHTLFSLSLPRDNLCHNWAVTHCGIY